MIFPLDMHIVAGWTVGFITSHVSGVRIQAVIFAGRSPKPAKSYPSPPRLREHALSWRRGGPAKPLRFQVRALARLTTASNSLISALPLYNFKRTHPSSAIAVIIFKRGGQPPDPRNSRALGRRMPGSPPVPVPMLS